MADEAVLVERTGAVATLTLNRPDIRNAMTAEVTDAFTAALEKVRRDRGVRAVVVTGAGPAFCSGGDLSFIQPGPGASVPDIRDKMRAFYQRYLAVRTLEVPTIAAVNGAAIGAGMCLALACDMRVVATDAKISTGFTKIGLHPGMAATYLLTRLIGPGRAADLLFTARTLGGEEAVRLGVAERVVEPGRLVEEAKALAEQIAANAPLAMRLVKRGIQLAERADLETVLEYEALAQSVTMASEDLLEGLAAVKERRPPAFEDR